MDSPPPLPSLANSLGRCSPHHISLASQDDTLTILRLASKEAAPGSLHVVNVLKFDEQIEGHSWSQDGRALVVLFRGSLKVFLASQDLRAITERCTLRLYYHGRDVRIIFNPFDPSQYLVGVCGSPGFELVAFNHDLAFQDLKHDVTLHQDQYITCLSFSPSGRFLALGGMDGQLWIWETKTVLENSVAGKPCWRTEISQLRMTSIAFDYREERVAVGTWNGSLRIFQRKFNPSSSAWIEVTPPRVQSLNEGRALKEMSPGTFVEWSTEGTHLLVAGTASFVYDFETQNETMLDLEPKLGAIKGLAVIPATGDHILYTDARRWFTGNILNPESNLPRLAIKHGTATLVLSEGAGGATQFTSTEAESSQSWEAPFLPWRLVVKAAKAKRETGKLCELQLAPPRHPTLQHPEEVGNCNEGIRIFKGPPGVTAVVIFGMLHVHLTKSPSSGWTCVSTQGGAVDGGFLDENNMVTLSRDTFQLWKWQHETRTWSLAAQTGVNSPKGTICTRLCVVSCTRVLVIWGSENKVTWLRIDCNPELAVQEMSQADTPFPIARFHDINLEGKVFMRVRESQESQADPIRWLSLDLEERTIVVQHPSQSQ